MYKLLTFALIAAATLSGCSKSSNPAPAGTMPSGQTATAPASSGDAVDQKLQTLAGSSATACGRVAPGADVQPATDCAMKANEAKHAFYVAYDMPGMTVGLAGAPDGKLYAVTHTAEAYSPAAGEKGQLSEDKHLLTMDCPAPLRVAQSGRVTCYPAASAPGASPHGGGMGGMSPALGGNPHGGGMMAAPAGSDNPHGSVLTTPGAANPHAGSGGKIPPKPAGTT